MTNYYNEHDTYAAQWLRNLIEAGLIAPGEVDTRSIEDVVPSDLAGFTQCHFFAGVGVWSYALRRAGWPDDRKVWTGSCPCQPFSAAGKGAGFDDDRHLWPAWERLIKIRRPAAVFGEQVASKDANVWIDLVCADLEEMGYAFGAVAFPSAGIGAPHIRDRLYWLADTHDARLEGRRAMRERADQRVAGTRGMAGRLAHADQQSGGQGSALGARRDRGSDAEQGRGPRRDGIAGRLANTDSGQRDRLAGRKGSVIDWTPGERDEGHGELERCGQDGEWPGPTNGVWRAADWLLCTDGKWRPVEPGTFPLADGSPARVGRLRAYGNAINADAAEAFIRAAYPELTA